MSPNSSADRSIVSSKSSAATGVVDQLGPDVAVVGRERLPLDGQHAMPLQVAERAVVGEDVEAVVDALEGPAGLVPAVLPIADVGRDQSDRRSSAPSLRTRSSSCVSGSRECG